MVTDEGFEQVMDVVLAAGVEEMKRFKDLVARSVRNGIAGLEGKDGGNDSNEPSDGLHVTFITSSTC